MNTITIDIIRDEIMQVIKNLKIRYISKEKKINHINFMPLYKIEKMEYINNEQIIIIAFFECLKDVIELKENELIDYQTFRKEYLKLWMSKMN